MGTLHKVYYENSNKYEILDDVEYNKQKAEAEAEEQELLTQERNERQCDQMILDVEKEYGTYAPDNAEHYEAILKHFVSIKAHCYLLDTLAEWLGEQKEAQVNIKKDVKAALERQKANELGDKTAISIFAGLIIVPAVLGLLYMAVTAAMV